MKFCLNQTADDDRRHNVWVLIGSQLMRCSVHSVRPVTSLERISFEVSPKEDPTQWCSISDLLPQRDFTDLEDQVPGEDEVEEPFLPGAPDASTQLCSPTKGCGQTKGSCRESGH